MNKTKINCLKKYLTTIFFVIVLIIHLDMVYSKYSNERYTYDSYSNVKYETELLNELNTSNTVQVIVKIKDDSGIKISRDNSEEKQIKNLEKKNYLNKKTEDILASLRKEDYKIKRKFLLGGFSVDITKNGFEKLVKNINVDAIYKNDILYPSLIDSRPIINADDVEDIGYTGAGQTVCVVDTGIDYTHTYLGDCLGSGCKVLYGHNFVNESASSIDTNGHGTMIAGIVASEHSNYRGIAPDAHLFNMKVCTTAHDCYLDGVIDALQFCLFFSGNYNISVVSMSLGDNRSYTYSTCPETTNSEINDLYNVGIPVVIATGNNGYTNGISHPACLENATPVGATYKLDYDREPDSGTYASNGIGIPAYCYDSNTDVDNLACFTNRHTDMLDLLAPGVYVGSTYLNDGWGSSLGTSVAAPHVSGVIALMAQLRDDLTVEQIEAILKDTGVTVGSYKRVNALAAINRIKDFDDDGYNGEEYGGSDCNDNNANINPGEDELCTDNIDNDCDGNIDEDDTECDKSDGQSCSLDNQCHSGNCDNDGVGATDDYWCFSSYNTYFDNQETTKCEYSTGFGVSACDEYAVGTNVNICSGISYYEEECSSVCGYQDDNSTFECNGSGCSCPEPLCDEKAIGQYITACGADETYFADVCNSTADNVEGTDNICRSSTYGSGCTADLECNGIEAGTDECFLNCTWNPDFDPNVTLEYPSNGFISEDDEVTFNCSTVDDKKLQNITLFTDVSGAWEAYETRQISGLSDSEVFVVDSIPNNMTFSWNCLVYDNKSQSGWGPLNYTFTTNITKVYVESIELVKNQSNNAVVEFVLNNGRSQTASDIYWTYDTGDTTVRNSAINMSLEPHKRGFVIIDYNYSSSGTFTIFVNVSHNGDSDAKNLSITI